MNKFFATAMAITVFASTSFAQGRKTPVAEGFLDWEGVSPKTFVFGKLLNPSDLRHRVVIYLVVDAEKFTNETLPDFKIIPPLAPLPSSHLVQWETQDMPRERILVVSLRNASRKLDLAEFAKIFRPPKDCKPADTTAYNGWRTSRASFYRDLAPANEEEIPLGNLPYVAVYGGSGTEPVYKKEKWTDADAKTLRAAVGKATKDLPEWKPPLGVVEPQFYKDIAEDIAEGKPAQRMLAKLVTGIKSKNAEQSKEAQIMYDALNQYKSDLALRIELEYSAAPARAYYDFQQLVKMFPSEKRKLQKIDAMMKQNKEVGAIGKIFEKIMLWNSDDFVCKNAAEAKKIVLELKKIRKALDNLANSKNTSVQGEAMLFQSQIDALIEIIPTKVPQK